MKYTREIQTAHFLSRGKLVDPEDFQVVDVLPKPRGYPRFASSESGGRWANGEDFVEWEFSGRGYLARLLVWAAQSYSWEVYNEEYACLSPYLRFAIKLFVTPELSLNSLVEELLVPICGLPGFLAEAESLSLLGSPVKAAEWILMHEEVVREGQSVGLYKPTPSNKDGSLRFWEVRKIGKYPSETDQQEIANWGKSGLMTLYLLNRHGWILPAILAQRV